MAEAGSQTLTTSEVIESDGNDSSFRDASDIFFTERRQISRPQNDYDESWGSVDIGALKDLWMDPNPRLLLVLLCLPYVILVYNSVYIGIGAYTLLMDLLLYWSYMLLFTLAILTTVKLYCERQKIFEWALRLLYHYNGNIVPVILNDGRKVLDQSVQTNENDFQHQADVMRNNHSADMKRIRKHVFYMKKKFSQRVRDLKDIAKERNDILTRLQLRFPAIEHEKDTLMAEREACEKQLEEEKRRNKELVGRFQRISQQFGKLIHPQCPPPLMSLDLGYHPK